jgi:hypothetical protein
MAGRKWDGLSGEFKVSYANKSKLDGRSDVSVTPIRSVKDRTSRMAEDRRPRRKRTRTIEEPGDAPQTAG